jgi:hypothetical protein
LSQSQSGWVCARWTGSTALENARDACSTWGKCGTATAAGVNRSAFEQRAAGLGGGRASGQEVSEWYAEYAAEYGWYAAYARADSDWGYICPAHRHATLILGAPGRTAPTFRYWWSHLTQDWPERSCYNVSHDAEVFDLLVHFFCIENSCSQICEDL